MRAAIQVGGVPRASEYKHGDGAAELGHGAKARPVDAAFWRDRRVLLTGHTGFKGAWLALWLQSLGARLTGFAPGAPTRPSLYELARVGDGMQSIAGDVRDYRGLTAAIASSAPEVVIHMAAQSLVRRSYVEPRETYDTNVMGTVNVLEAVRHAEGVRVVVAVTSDKCYETEDASAERAWQGHREEEPMGGGDPYSSSKAAAELAIDAYRSAFFADRDGARVASARAGNAIGGGDWGQDRLLPDLMRAALTGKPVRLRNPYAIRPWQHVLNPLSGYLVLTQALWGSADHAGAWNFGPPENDAQQVSWVVERVAALWPGELRWELDEGSHPRETRHLALNSSKASQRLGWRPPLSLDAALEATVEWYCALREGADMRSITVGQIEALDLQAA